MTRPKYLILMTVLLSMLSAQALPARAAEDRRGDDVILGGGISTDPNDNVTSITVGFSFHFFRSAHASP